MTQTYTARWIFPVDAPPLERGLLTIVGTQIAAIEPHGARTPDIDLGNAAILPGFVNAHTHLDLSGFPPSPPGRGAGGEGEAMREDFTHWLRRVIAFRRTRSPEQVQTDIAAGIAECLRFGATLIGDIASAGASWPLLTNANCRSVAFYELLGLSESRGQHALQQANDWLKDHPNTERNIAGLSPHAPYSARYSALTQHSALSTQHFPLATHLAETREELELLERRTGPFVDFLKEMNVYDPTGLVRDPLEIVQALPNGIFVHCNYLDPATPFLPTQTVVFCPRTHAAFGHARHPFPEFLKRGVRVALGTDSLASNPDLDILAEARFIRREYPEVSPAAILRMLTLSGAEALGFAQIAGSLTPGKSADFVVLPLPDGDATDPHDLVLGSEIFVDHTIFGGIRR